MGAPAFQGVSCFVGSQMQFWGAFTAHSPKSMAPPDWPEARAPVFGHLWFLAACWQNVSGNPGTAEQSAPATEMRWRKPTRRPGPPAGFTPALTPWAGGLPLLGV